MTRIPRTITAARLAALALVLLCAPACGARSREQGIVRVGGSTTLLPAVAACARALEEAHPTWRSMDASLADAPIRVYVNGGGSGAGLRALEDGTLDAALVSRDVDPAEAARLGDHDRVLLGFDAVAIATSRRSPFAARRGFSREELARIFSGEVRRASELDPALGGGEIVLLARDPGAGSSELLAEVVLGARVLDPRALLLPSQGALLRRLVQNESAIAYVSSGLVEAEPGLVAYEVDGIPPSPGEVGAGRYPLTRPLLLVHRAGASPELRRFAAELVAPSCAPHLSAAGFVPAATVSGSGP